MAHRQFTVQVFDEDYQQKELTLELLGEWRGRCGILRKVKDTRSEKIYIQKIFSPGPAIKGFHLLYRQWFFPYTTDENALRANFYEDKILALLSTAINGYPLVAEDVGTGWDAEHRAGFLIKEYVEGRGPRPGCPDEMKNLIKDSKEIQRFVVETGSVGNAWQADTGLAFPFWANFGLGTSNFLITETGLRLIDTQSSIPAFTSYGRRNGYFPQYDNKNTGKLRKFVEKNKTVIREKLGEGGSLKLDSYIEKLEHHQREWKERELDLFNNGFSVLTDKHRRKMIKLGLANHLTKKYPGLKAENVERSPCRYAACNAGTEFFNVIESSRVYKFITDREYRKEVGRKIKEGLTKTWWILSDEEYRLQWSRDYINGEIDRWGEHDRILPEQRLRLRETINSEAEDMVEYVTDFGMQLPMKLLGWSMRFYFGIKPASDALLDLIYHPENSLNFLALPEFWLAIFSSGILRTAYTAYRKIRKPHISFKQAFKLGIWPFIGNFSFPAQLYRKYPEVSEFMTNNLASKASKKIPLIGEENTRFEDLTMRLFNKLMGVLKN